MGGENPAVLPGNQLKISQGRRSVKVHPQGMPSRPGSIPVGLVAVHEGHLSGSGRQQLSFCFDLHLSLQNDFHQVAVEGIPLQLVSRRIAEVSYAHHMQQMLPRQGAGGKVVVFRRRQHLFLQGFHGAHLPLPARRRPYVHGHYSMPGLSCKGRLTSSKRAFPKRWKARARTQSAAVPVFSPAMLSRPVLYRRLLPSPGVQQNGGMTSDAEPELRFMKCG